MALLIFVVTKNVKICIYQVKSQYYLHSSHGQGTTWFIDLPQQTSSANRKILSVPLFILTTADRNRGGHLTPAGLIKFSSQEFEIWILRHWLRQWGNTRRKVCSWDGSQKAKVVNKNLSYRKAIEYNMHCSMPFYMRNLSIHRFWYLQREPVTNTPWILRDNCKFCRDKSSCVDFQLYESAPQPPHYSRVNCKWQMPKHCWARTRANKIEKSWWWTKPECRENAREREYNNKSGKLQRHQCHGRQDISCVRSQTRILMAGLLKNHFTHSHELLIIRK